MNTDASNLQTSEAKVSAGTCERNSELPPTLAGMRVAIVHYWFVRRRGGEQVVEELARLFPQADIFTMFLDPHSFPEALRSHNVTTSFLQKVPGITHRYRYLLPLFPLALEQLDLDKYDLVISSEAGPAKGVLTRSRSCHICYCHTPLRYVWEMFHHYRSTAPMGGLGRTLYSLLAHYVRQWDYAASARVDYFAASSRNGAARVRKYYRREARVIYPPIDISAFSPDSAHDDFYLVVSPLVSYKRIDLAIEACNALGRRLIVIGGGEELPVLRKLAGSSVKFLGVQPDEVVREHYRHCRAFLFPGEEDIGLTPIEAQASGRPVIAYGRGGALETVKGFFAGDAPLPESSTGVFFAEQSVGALAEAMRIFESTESHFVPSAIRAQVVRFDVSRFRQEMVTFVTEKTTEFRQLSCPTRPTPET